MTATGGHGISITYDQLKKATTYTPPDEYKAQAEEIVARRATILAENRYVRRALSKHLLKEYVGKDVNDDTLKNISTDSHRIALKALYGVDKIDDLHGRSRQDAEYFLDSIAISPDEIKKQLEISGVTKIETADDMAIFINDLFRKVSEANNDRYQAGLRRYTTKQAGAGIRTMAAMGGRFSKPLDKQLKEFEEQNDSQRLIGSYARQLARDIDEGLSGGIETLVDDIIRHQEGGHEEHHEEEHATAGAGHAHH